MKPTPMRVIVTGSRTWTDRDAVYGSLDLLAQAAMQARVRLVVAHGACPDGGDRLADEWVTSRKRMGWPVDRERHPAEWKKYGRRAGPLRNAQKLVRPGADACLAFINPCEDAKCKNRAPHGSHGATDCADRAEGAGIPTQRIERADA